MIVTVDVPVVAAALAVSAKVLVAVVGLVPNDALTPLGTPDADKVTLPLKPFSGVTVMALEPLNPWATVRLLGDAERLKFAGALTVREMVVV